MASAPLIDLDESDERRAEIIKAKLSSRNIGCDLIVRIGEQSFMTSREVLSRIPFFKVMFFDNPNLGKETILPLDKSVVDPDIFDEILNFLYTGEITFTPENLERLYLAAKHFNFFDLSETARCFIKLNINQKFLGPILQIVRTFNMGMIEEECKHYLIHNAPDDPRLVRYLRTFEDLTLLLDNMLTAERYEDMFTYSMEWLKTLETPEELPRYLVDVLRRIPLDKLSISFFEMVTENFSEILDNLECLKILFKAVVKVKSNAPKPIEKLYVLFGKNRQVLNSISRFDTSTREWVTLSGTPMKLSHFACTSVGEKIYIAGGNNGKTDMNSMIVFDTTNHQYKVVKPMKYRRQGCGIARLGDYLYVAGGSKGPSEALASTERFCLSTGKWADVAPMNLGRNGLEMLTLGGYLYAIGGHIGKKYSNTVEKYCPDTDTWVMVAPTLYTYGWFGAVVYKGNIYIAGNDNKFEVYSPTADTWKVLPKMISPCEGGRKLAVFEGKLLAIGGRKGDLKDWEGTTEVESFDVESNKWTAEKTMAMFTKRCYHSVAVVKKDAFST